MADKTGFSSMWCTMSRERVSRVATCRHFNKTTVSRVVFPPSEAAAFAVASCLSQEVSADSEQVEPKRGSEAEMHSGRFPAQVKASTYGKEDQESQ